MYRKFNKEEQEKEDLRININPNKQNKKQQVIIFHNPIYNR